MGIRVFLFVCTVLLAFLYQRPFLLRVLISQLFAVRYTRQCSSRAIQSAAHISKTGNKAPFTQQNTIMHVHYRHWCCAVVHTAVCIWYSTNARVISTCYVLPHTSRVHEGIQYFSRYSGPTNCMLFTPNHLASLHAKAVFSRYKGGTPLLKPPG